MLLVVQLYVWNGHCKQGVCRTGEESRNKASFKFSQDGGVLLATHLQVFVNDGACAFRLAIGYLYIILAAAVDAVNAAGDAAAGAAGTGAVAQHTFF